ncbi:MAG TPA: SDR family oxidoreductase [Acidimicrobiia bacterium]|nr:SDR family oxidoreductase [Acidimicrobiia bacterium]
MDRTIAVVGSASGMGAATRARLEKAGDRVIGVDQSGAEVVADLGTSDGRGAAVAGVTEASGGALDGLVLAAGVGVPTATPQRCLTVNYFGIRAVLDGLRPVLAARPPSYVVIIGSNGALCIPDLPDDVVEACLDGDEARALDLAAKYHQVVAYGGSKLAIMRWARRAATTADWAGAGIRLNVYAPGATATPMLDRALADAEFAAMAAGQIQPVGGPVPAEHVAAWIEMMLSDAAEFLCGQIISVDSGTEAFMRAEHWPVTLPLGLSWAL